MGCTDLETLPETPPAAPVATEFFRTADVAVRQWRGFSNACCFVTFDSYTDHRGLDRTGFAEQFLGEHRIDAIHIITSENDWYQYADMLDVFARICELTAGYDKVVAYGSSMGGYAAIRFGRLVGAKLALALSPQFSIDPLRVPFENRWNDSTRIMFRHEANPPPFVDTAIILYDKNDLDARHVDLFRPHTKVIDVGLLNCGHPCSGFLVELDLLQKSVMEVARGTFDAAMLEREGRRRRKEAGQFYLTLCRRSRNPRRRLELAERAVLHGTANISYLANLATISAAAGSFTVAMDALDRCAEIAPAHPVVRYHRSDVLEMAGDLPGAIAALEDVPPEFVKNGGHAARLERLKDLAFELDQKARSLATAQSVQDPATDSPHFRDTPRPSGKVFHAKNLVGRVVERLKWTNARRTYQRPFSVRLDVELRVTTFPSPPPFFSSWRRHDRLLRHLPHVPIDLCLVGDSLTEYWPETAWAPWQVFNFGVAADKTQHVIWRLDELTRPIAAAHVLIMAGTNNLGAGDTPDGIVAGIAELVGRVSRNFPDASIVVVEIPPCGPEFDFRDADRKRINLILAAAKWTRTINVDRALMSADHAANPYYMPDQIHFSAEGYRLLTGLIREMWQ